MHICHICHACMYFYVHLYVTSSDESECVCSCISHYFNMQFQKSENFRSHFFYIVCNVNYLNCSSKYIMITR